MMEIFTDLEQGSSSKYGRLTLLASKVGKTEDGHIVGHWLCDCGTEVRVAESRVRNGYTRSCGCLSADVSRANVKHGMRGTPEYSSWRAMINRCCNPRSKDYSRYGGAGVTVAPEWREFEPFFEHLGLRPAGTTLDRIDTLRGYEPGNCRWSTPTEQAENTRATWVIQIGNRIFNSAEDAAREHGVSTTTIHRWCDGYVDARRIQQKNRGRIDPKPGCKKWRRYNAS